MAPSLMCLTLLWLSTILPRLPISMQTNFDGFISCLAFDVFHSNMFASSPGEADEAAANPKDMQFVKDVQEAFSLAGVAMWLELS